MGRRTPGKHHRSFERRDGEGHATSGSNDPLKEGIRLSDASPSLKLHHWYAIRSAVSAALAGVVLAACATGSEMAGPPELRADAPCCALPSEAKYTTLRLETEASVELRKGAPVHQFLQGRSFYAAFALPPHTGPEKIVFKTFVAGIILPYATVVRPYFVFLDESKNEISLVPDPPVFPGTDFILGQFFKGEVDVPQNAVYVIIHTSDRPVTPWPLYAENGMEWPATPSMTGNLRIIVKGR